MRQLSVSIVFLTMMSTASPPALSQQKSEPGPSQQKTAPTQQSDSQNDFWSQIKRLDWQLGPTQGEISGVASIKVPKGSAFLGTAGTRRFLELQGNIVSDNRYTFAPADISWFSAFSFDLSGHVTDDEKIDPDELLQILNVKCQIQRRTEAARIKRARTRRLVRRSPL